MWVSSLSPFPLEDGQSIGIVAASEQLSFTMITVLAREHVLDFTLPQHPRRYLMSFPQGLGGPLCPLLALLYLKSLHMENNH